MKLQVSNSLDALAHHMCEAWKSAPIAIFQPFTIVTQTDGMYAWLRLTIAQRLGIAMHLEHFTPNQLIFRIYSLLGGKYPKTLSAENTRWVLFNLLGSAGFKNKFPDIARYYTADTADAASKRLSLAYKVADLFDQYQIYRPEMIELWNENRLENNQEAWQAWLWQEAKALTNQELADKTLIRTYIFQQLKNPEAAAHLKQYLPEVYCFGISIMTDYHLSILNAVSDIIEVHMLTLNPAPLVYWQDDKSDKVVSLWKQRHWNLADSFSIGNDLLMSWGKVINDTFKLYFNYDNIANSYQTIELAPPPTDTLLHTIQNDLYHNATTDRNSISQAQLADGSITINACYTKLREVESLYNYFIYLFAEKKEALSTRDIVVMVNNMADYAPYIRAVFSFAPTQFRYTIADEQLANGDHVFEAFLKINALTEATFTPENVLQLLEYSAIRARFQIDDLAAIRQAIVAANIRFGFTGEGPTQTWIVSWQYGMQRIMLGLCMSGALEFETHPHNLYPIDVVEGNRSIAVVRFVHFVQQLIAAIQSRHRQRTLIEWSQYAELLVQNFLYDGSTAEPEDINTLVKQLQQYQQMPEWLPEIMSFEVFNQHLQQHLQSFTRSYKFLSGGITFCSMVPMRSIPFKVVALLGINYNQFPRHEKQLSFNLMTQQVRPGDRSVKDNDNHLFLETILSARDYLYISYIGRNVKDNSVVPPAATVDELIDYITAGTGQSLEAVTATLVTRQPLHSYSKAYFENDPRLQNYFLSPVTTTLQINDENKSDEVVIQKELSMQHWINFYRNPIKFYYQNVYQIFYSTKDEVIPDTELFELDQLHTWQLHQKLFPLSPEEMLAYKQTALYQGALPLSHMADVVWDQLVTEVRDAQSDWNVLVQDRAFESKTATVALDDFKINGQWAQVSGGKHYEVIWSKHYKKYFLSIYLQHLLGVACGAFTSTIILHAPNKTFYHSHPISKQEAMQRLYELLIWYVSGHERMILFFDALIQDNNYLKAANGGMAAVVEQLINNESIIFDDPYVINAYEQGLMQDQDASRDTAFVQTVLQPALEFFILMPPPTS